MSKSLLSFSKQISSLKLIFRKNVIHQEVFYSDQASRPPAIDSFTENLVLEKSLKWDNLIKVSDTHSTNNNSSKPLVKVLENKNKKHNLLYVIKDENLTMKQFITNINECAKLNNIPELIINLKICQNKNYCPPKEQLLFLAKIFTINKNVEGIQILQYLCKTNYPLEYRIQSHYDHFLAEVLWTEGNVKDSLNLFGTVYCDNVVLRGQIKIMLCNRFSEIVTNHGEASRIIVVNFVKMIADKHCDYSLMGYLWKVLFESDWFSDQQLSIILLKDNHQLKYVIEWMLPLLGRQLLQGHKVDSVYRLIEVLLSNDMKQQCGTILRLLFDYKYNHGDLKGCTSVVKACSDLDLPLTERQEKKFICLLLKTQPKLDKLKEFELKF